MLNDGDQALVQSGGGVREDSVDENGWIEHRACCIHRDFRGNPVSHNTQYSAPVLFG